MVLYGDYKNPEIINIDHLNEIHNLIKNVKFIVSDFKLVLEQKNINDEDYMYQKIKNHLCNIIKMDLMR